MAAVLSAASKISGQVEGDKSNFRSGAFWIHGDDMLMKPGAGFQLLLGVIRIDVHMSALAAVTGQTVLRVVGLADGPITLAEEHGAVASHVFAIEAGDLRGRVGAVIGEGLDAKMKASKIHVHVGGPVVAVFREERRAGVDGEANAALNGGFIGFHGQAAKRGRDADIVLVVSGFAIRVTASEQRGR